MVLGLLGNGLLGSYVLQRYQTESDRKLERLKTELEREVRTLQTALDRTIRQRRLSDSRFWLRRMQCDDWRIAHEKE